MRWVPLFGVFLVLGTLGLSARNDERRPDPPAGPAPAFRLTVRLAETDRLIADTERDMPACRDSRCLTAAVQPTGRWMSDTSQLLYALYHDEDLTPACRRAARGTMVLFARDGARVLPADLPDNVSKGAAREHTDRLQMLQAKARDLVRDTYTACRNG